MNAEQIRNSWDDDHDVTQPCAFPEPLVEVLTRENRELRAIAADATTAAQNLRDDLQAAHERLRAVETLLDPDAYTTWGGDPDGWLIRESDLRAALPPAASPADRESWVDAPDDCAVGNPTLDAEP